MGESSLQEIKAKPTSVCAKGHPLKPNNRNPILIVEDVYEIALQMRRALIQHGHEVITAANAEEAVQIAEQKLPAMILTDLELPTFDALTRLVYEHQDLKELPIAIMDINDPHLPDLRVKVLPDFDALDKLVESLSPTSSRG